MYLPVIVKEIQEGYLISPYFMDLYLYLAQNKLPSTKTAIQKVKTLAERYTLLDLLLFKIIPTPKNETALLAIPEVCVDNFITLYHSSLFTGHQGVQKMYFTISDKFFILGIIHCLHLYIKGCHICQVSCNKRLPTRKIQMRINLNNRPLSRSNMDLKVIPRSNKGHKYILCIIDEIMNYLIKIPIHQWR